MDYLRRPLRALFLSAEAIFDRPFGAEWNPLRQLGALTFFLFWVVAVSGIYLYVFFRTGVVGAYESVESLTHVQWYAGGVMRSLHRYASDAMVVTTLVHLAREFAYDRYRGVRWFAWFTGVPAIWLLYVSGVSGYWLIWDQLAQYVATASMEWLDGLGIFGEPVANNFLAPGSLSDRFFSLLVFIHIFGPLFLLFVMWIHVLRITRPRVNPPRGLALGTMATLTALSLAKPALSHGPADLATVPTVVNLDWFYLLLYPLFDLWGAGALWALAGGLSLIVAFMPWLPPFRRPRAAAVTLDQCNGCGRCYADCPYGAVSLRPRTDDRPFEQEAVVNPALCVSCGICVGACPPSTPFRTVRPLRTGIDLPDSSLGELKARTLEAMERAAKARPGVVVFACAHGAEARRIEGPGVAVVGVPCVGMVPPSFVDFVVSRSANAVVVAGCREAGCYHRLGVAWVEERFAGRRDPHLRPRVPRARVRTVWASPLDLDRLAASVAELRTALGAAAEILGRGDEARSAAGGAS